MPKTTRGSQVGQLSQRDAHDVDDFREFRLPLEQIGAGALQIIPAQMQAIARDLHPDRHPGAAEDDRRALEARFNAVAAAYRRILPGG